MFATTTTNGETIEVRISFGQAVKAGLGFTLGACLLLPVTIAVLGVAGVTFGGLWSLLTTHH